MLARANQKRREEVPPENSGHVSLKVVEQCVSMVQLKTEVQERYDGRR